MKLIHFVSNSEYAAKVVREGFRDSIADKTSRGVAFCTEHQNDGMPWRTRVVVEIPEDVAALYELHSDTFVGRVFWIPSEVANSYGPPQYEPD